MGKISFRIIEGHLSWRGSFSSPTSTSIRFFFPRQACSRITRTASYKFDVSICRPYNVYFRVSRQGFHIPGFLPELQPAAVGKTDNGVVTTHDDDHACHEKPISTNGDSKGSDNKPQEGGDSSTEKRDITADPLVEDGARAGGHSTLPRTALLHHPLCLKHFSCPPIRRSSDPPPENVKRLEVIYNEVCSVERL